MEMLITVLGYIAVFGSAAVLGLIPGVIAYFLTKKSLGKWWSYFVGVVVVLCVLLSLSRKPILLYTQDCENSLTEVQEDAVRAVCAGPYSPQMPLLPMVIFVAQAEEDYAAWTEYYFPYGTREMELSGADGYNCTKYLLPWT